jgi:hypothetical protein
LCLTLDVGEINFFFQSKLYSWNRSQDLQQWHRINHLSRLLLQTFEIAQMLFVMV